MGLCNRCHIALTELDNDGKPLDTCNVCSTYLMFEEIEETEEMLNQSLNYEDMYEV